MKTSTQATCLLATGGCLVVTMSVLLGCFQLIYNTTVDGTLELAEGKKIMEAFTIPPVPIYMSFYLFNVRNPQDVQYYGAIPDLEEIGPYVYEETREKYDINFSDDGETVRYYNKKNYYFRQDLSGDLKESDTVTTLNVIMVMLAALGHDMDKIYLLWPEIERTMDVFQTITISQALFEGWDLPEFNFNFSFIPGLEALHYNGTLADIMRQANISEDNIPDIIKGNKVGYYSMMNGTSDGLYEVFTGKKDMTQYINVMEWNEEPALSFWNDPYCDMINGTDGTQFPPRTITKSTTVRIFVTELCRSLYLNYEEELDYFGVRVLRFVPPADMLASPTINEDNKCYTSTMGPLSSSLLEMTPCVHIPLVMSTPHFYQGDGDELAKYKGLNPSKLDHETILDIEPTLGIPLRAHKRIQLNLPLRPYGGLTSFLNFKPMFFPVLWADENAELTESDTDTLKTVLKLPFTLAYVIGGILLAGACIMMLVGLKKRHTAKRQTV